MEIKNNPYWKKLNFLDYARNMLKDKGFVHTVKRMGVYSFDLLYGRVLFLAPKREFYFNGKKFRYFYHRYNKTWRNERAVEIPIGLVYINRFRDGKILEVGNVLSHYVKIRHDVLDKYEDAKGVLNEDVIKFKPKKKYDLIISLSTMEHVGVDDFPPEPGKVIKGLINLKKNCLSKNGVFLLSFPTNYNPALNDMINGKHIKNFKMFCFRRTEKRRNIWKECEYVEVKKLNPAMIDGVIFIEINKNTQISYK